MEYSKEFKEEIIHLPPKEKDKLLLRLLRKDKILSEKLYFELVDPETLDDKFRQMEVSVKEQVKIASKYIRNSKYFLVCIRRISAEITHHVKVTSDQFGEVYLTVLMVKTILKLNNSELSDLNIENTYKLYLYLLNKIFRALILLQKLNRDYWMELKEPLQEIEKLILENRILLQLSINNGLDLHWLDIENLPENIAEIQKEIKSQGFLR